MTMLKIGDVTVGKVIELDRSATPVGFEKHADTDAIILAAHFPVSGRIVAPGGRARFKPVAS